MNRQGRFYDAAELTLLPNRNPVIVHEWTLYVLNNNKGPGVAAATVDNLTVAQGNSSAQITVLSVAANSYDIQFQRGGISLNGGLIFHFSSGARADTARAISVLCNSMSGTLYGLSQQFSIGATWQFYSASFTAAANATDGIIEFSVGDVAGSVWLDGVTLSVTPLATYRRDFGALSVPTVLAPPLRDTMNANSPLRYRPERLPLIYFLWQRLICSTDTGHCQGGTGRAAGSVAFPRLHRITDGGAAKI